MLNFSTNLNRADDVAGQTRRGRRHQWWLRSARISPQGRKSASCREAQEKGPELTDQQRAEHIKEMAREVEADEMG
jgi:hypothetical protein